MLLTSFEFPVVRCKEELCSLACLTASPWETRHLKAEMAEAKAQKANLEEQIKKLHHTRMELELMYDNEKTRFIKEQERDRETVRLIINRKCFLFNTSRLAVHKPTQWSCFYRGCTNCRCQATQVIDLVQ
jgi:hypothetical protein